MKKEISKSYIIRMTPSLRKKAEDVSQELGLSFSAYVRQLVSKDISKANN